MTASWPAELKRRIGAAWVGKMLATTLGIGAFFVAYFWVLPHPEDAVAVMPLTPLDRLVPIAPLAMPFYLSLWLYVSLGPALLRNGRELAGYGAATFVMSAVGLAIFLVWPTSTPDFGVDWTRYPTMAFLKTVDVSANACPSLHVAFAVFSGIRLDRLLREIGLGSASRLASFLWCAGIVYSTLAVRQHVVLDVIAGAGLGALVAWASLATQWPFRPAAATISAPAPAGPAASVAGPSRTARAAARARTG